MIPGFWEAALRVMGALTVILILAVLALPYLKRFAQQGGFGPSTLPAQVLGRQMLGRKHALYVVRMAEKVLVLGVSEASMTLLTEMPASQWPAATPAPGPMPSSFPDLLRSVITRHGR